MSYAPITRQQAPGLAPPRTLLLMGIGILMGLLIVKFQALPAQWAVASLGALWLIWVVALVRNVERIFVGLLALTLCLNVDINITRDLSHTGGVSGFVLSLHNIATLALLVLWGVDLALRRTEGMRLLGWTGVLALAVLALTMFSLKNARSVELGLYQVFELLKLLIAAWFMGNYVYRKPDELKFLVAMLLIGLGLESILAIAQFATQSTLGLAELGARRETMFFTLGGRLITRPSGTLGNPNTLAQYLVTMLPLPVCLLFLRPRSGLRAVLISLVGLGVAGLIVAFSRGGWGAFILVMLIVLGVGRKDGGLGRRMARGFVGLLLVAGLVGALAAFDNPIRDRFTKDDRGSAYSRIPMMEVAGEMIRAHPWLGVGFNNYTEVHQRYDKTSMRITRHFPHPVHNVYLQVAAEIGLPGLMFYLLLCAHVFWMTIKFRDPDWPLATAFMTAIGAGMAGRLMMGLAENGNIGSFVFLQFWMFAALAAGIVARHRKDKAPSPASGETIRYEPVNRIQTDTP